MSANGEPKYTTEEEDVSSSSYSLGIRRLLEEPMDDDVENLLHEIQEAIEDSEALGDEGIYATLDANDISELSTTSIFEHHHPGFMHSLFGTDKRTTDIASVEPPVKPQLSFSSLNWSQSHTLPESLEFSYNESSQHTERNGQRAIPQRAPEHRTGTVSQNPENTRGKHPAILSRINEKESMVDINETTVEADDHESEERPGRGKRRVPRAVWFLLAILLLLAIAGIVGGVLSKNYSSKRTNAQEDAIDPETATKEPSPVVNTPTLAPTQKVSLPSDDSGPDTPIEDSSILNPTTSPIVPTAMPTISEAESLTVSPTASTAEFIRQTIADNAPFSINIANSNILSPQAQALSWVQSNTILSQVSTQQILQRYSLAVLYYSSNGNFWGINSGWLQPGLSECDWFQSSATTCNTEGLLLSLDVANNGLSGTLPNELALLAPSLTRLIVANNKLEGSLPTMLSSLSNLKILNLGGNEFVGSIPDSYGDLSLQLFSVFETKIHGSVPSSLANWSGIEKLYLGKTSLSGSVPESVCSPTLLDLWADCADVRCPCCTFCCSDGAFCSQVSV